MPLKVGSALDFFQIATPSVLPLATQMQMYAKTDGRLYLRSANNWPEGPLTVTKFVRVATRTNITLSAVQTIDGVALSIGDRVLVMRQTTVSQNGIYLVQSGAWTRATDANTDEKIAGAQVVPTEGTNAFVRFLSLNNTLAEGGWAAVEVDMVDYTNPPGPVGTLGRSVDGLLMISTGTAWVLPAARAHGSSARAAAAQVGDLMIEDSILKMHDGASFKAVYPVKYVRVATTAYSVLSGLQTIDGVTLVAGDRVLVRHQGTLGGGTASANGIYVAGTGTWTRATDFDTTEEAAHSVVIPTEGTLNAGRRYMTGFRRSSSLGSTAINFHSARVDIVDFLQFISPSADERGAMAMRPDFNQLYVQGTSGWVLTNGGAHLASAEPTSVSSSMLWFDTAKEELRVYDGTRFQRATPEKSVRVATTANIALDQTTTSVDGVTLVTGDYVMVKNQTTASQNGVYLASTTGAWSRAPGFDTVYLLSSVNTISVRDGSTQAGSLWTTNFPASGVLGTTALSWWRISVDDTGWINVTPGSGYALASPAAQYRVLEGVCYLRGGMLRSSGTGVAVGTLPVSASPAVTLSTYVRSGSNWITFSISSAGAIAINASHVTGDTIVFGSVAGQPYITN